MIAKLLMYMALSILYLGANVAAYFLGISRRSWGVGLVRTAIAMCGFSILDPFTSREGLFLCFVTVWAIDHIYARLFLPE